VALDRDVARRVIAPYLFQLRPPLVGTALALLSVATGADGPKLGSDKVICEVFALSVGPPRSAVLVTRTPLETTQPQLRWQKKGG